MAELPPSGAAAVPEVQARLQDVARRLRQPGSLDLATQGALAELVEELSTALAAGNVPPAELSHLADSTAHLAEALHHPQTQGLLGKARDRRELAVTNAEALAPTAVGLARRLLVALANIGI